MIYLDVTKSAGAGHYSGLNRVNDRISRELGPTAVAARWRDGLKLADGEPASPAKTDWFLTAELFAESERPGFAGFIEDRPCRLAAVFHDAIPMRFPHITWPRSVERHPAYLKSLARFDLVFSVSAASADDLAGYWRWLGVSKPPPIKVITLGADFDGSPRQKEHRPPSTVHRPPSLLCVGIIEPRKNQEFLVEVCRTLWKEGLEFDLHLVGRTNPHFGREIVAGIKKAQRRLGGLKFHGAASDERLAELYRTARATILPTLAEGCGLPLLESLWKGIPCVCSDVPAVRENAVGGGCLVVPVNDAAAWKDALRSVIAGSAAPGLASAAVSRPLPTWSECAAQLSSAFGLPSTVS